MDPCGCREQVDSGTQQRCQMIGEAIDRLRMAPRGQGLQPTLLTYFFQKSISPPSPQFLAASSFPDNSRLVGGKPPGDIPSPEPETWEAIYGVSNQFSKIAHTKRGVGEGTPPFLPSPEAGYRAPRLRVKGCKALLAQACGSSVSFQLFLGSASFVFSQWVYRNLFVSVSAALLPPSSFSIRGHPLWQIPLMKLKRSRTPLGA